MKITFISRQEIIDSYLDSLLNGEPISQEIQDMIKDFTCH